MLWLYITGLAILIGGEVNWVIENEDKHTAAFEAKKRSIEQRMKARLLDGRGFGKVIVFVQSYVADRALPSGPLRK